MRVHDKNDGHVCSNRVGRDSRWSSQNAYVTREPLGVFALITPWNFPIVIPAWKTAAALAYGNTVVLKPSEVTPGAACLLAQAIQAAQIPVGAFNLLLGTGANLGSALVTHPKVVGISFTGSVATGGKIALEAISHQKRLQLEMGGKNPLVVLDDAQVDVAVECAIDSAFLYTGQRCTASSRVIVTPGIYEKFLQALIERTEMLRVGDALDPKTQVGPIVNEAQLNKNLFYIDLAAQEGGTIYGGSRGSASGYFLKPCIVTELDNTSRVCREEIFGPVTSVIRAHDYEDALAIANDTAYGLASGICTTSLKHASHFKRHAKSGLVSVNMSTSGVDFHVPFGGRKGSSYGPREQGQSAVEFFTVVKTAYVRGGNGDVD
ncbi:aldehyde dehydrogenase family protein [Alcaligenaceae bacterium]|nr:aldehyde dehydrogenase family protein [Alcaligenaceae bacterium]